MTSSLSIRSWCGKISARHDDPLSELPRAGPLRGSSFAFLRAEIDDHAYSDRRKTTGSLVLVVARNRRESLLWAAGERRRRVSEAVPRFSVGRNPLVVFASFQEGRLTHIATGRRGANAATASVRLHLRHVEELTRPFPFSEITSAIPGGVRRHLQRSLHRGGVLPRRTSEALVDFMADSDDRVRDHLLVRLLEADDVLDYSPPVKENLALQKDALNIAFRIGGIEPDQLIEWHPAAVSHGSQFFLEGLPDIHTYEEDMILADLSTIPGFDLLHRTTSAIAHFRARSDPDNLMTVVMANRRPLELQTGVDLIYFSQKYQSFVMVQYKAMESEGGERRFRWRHEGQFMKEIERMHVTWRDLEKEAVSRDPDAFRLFSNPFFLKFCPREQFRPDDTSMFPGLYLPLDLWERLRQSGRLKGPQGGNVLTHNKAGRWLSNSDFIHLVSRSWIGTAAGQSGKLKSLIERAVASKRTTVFATKHDSDGKRDRVLPW